MSSSASRPSSSRANKVSSAAGAELEPPVTEALKGFRVIFRSVRQHFNEVEQRLGVSGSQLWALSVIVGRPGIRVKDLAQALAIQQSTASNLVEQLVRHALIRRERDQFDHRIVLLLPTEAGKAVIDKAPRPLAGILPDALGKLEPAQLDALNELLQQLVAALRHSEPEAAHTPLAEI